MAKNLKPVARFARDRGFTEPQVRWWLFHRHQNGMAEANVVVKLGRRVWIDDDAFDRWLDRQQPHYAQAA